jgi:microcystin-dependent protein
MHKIDGAGHLGGQFVSEDATTARPPTLVTPEWLNAVQGELVALVEAAGLTLDKANSEQVAEAIQSGKLWSSVAGGTADAITATFIPAVKTLKNGMVLYVRAAAANTATEPTFTPGVGLASKPIVKFGGTALVAGDIVRAGHWLRLVYDSALDQWELVNPAQVLGTQSGGTPAGKVDFFALNTAPAGYLKANGAAVSRTIYAALFAAIGTVFGTGDGSTTFNLPDLRGEFVRGLDDGRGVDSDRAIGTAQLDAMQGHIHGVRTDGGQGSVNGAQNLPSSSGTVNNCFTDSPESDGTNGVPRTAAETRPRNIALLACIKY